MVFHWSLSNSKSPQVFRTLLSILAVLCNAVIWIVSTRPPTSKSSSPFNNPLVIVPKAPITIGTIVTFMFHTFFNSLARSRYLFLFSHSFSFIPWSAYYYYYYYFGSFSLQRQPMFSHWSLSDSKFLQISRTLLGIFADHNNAVVWMVSNRLLISKSSRPCINPLITVTYIFLIIFSLIHIKLFIYLCTNHSGTLTKGTDSNDFSDLSIL